MTDVQDDRPVTLKNRLICLRNSRQPRAAAVPANLAARQKE
jgi:hypothetical protein